MTQDKGNTHEEQENGQEGKGADKEAHGRSYKDQESEEEFTEGLEHSSDGMGKVCQLYPRTRLVATAFAAAVL